MDPVIIQGYSIMGKYEKGEVEKVDEASTRREANYLLGEYRMAFGVGWRLWVAKDRTGGGGE